MNKLFDQDYFPEKELAEARNLAMNSKCNCIWCGIQRVGATVVDELRPHFDSGSIKINKRNRFVREEDTHVFEYLLYELLRELEN